MTKRAVRGSRTGRPIMALLDLLGRRWTLRIVWELREGPLTSRALRTACDEASPTVVQARLTELREAGLIELVQGDGYRLTELGKDLRVRTNLASLIGIFNRINCTTFGPHQHCAQISGEMRQARPTDGCEKARTNKRVEIVEDAGVLLFAEKNFLAQTKDFRDLVGESREMAG